MNHNSEHHTLKPLIPVSGMTLVQKLCRITAVLFFLMMVAAGSIPGKAEALSSFAHDKFLHFSAYSSLSLLLFGGIAGNLTRRAGTTLLLIALLGFLDEAIQFFLPYRNPAIADWLFNMLAASLVMMLMIMMQASVERRRNHRSP